MMSLVVATQLDTDVYVPHGKHFVIQNYRQSAGYLAFSS